MLESSLDKSIHSVLCSLRLCQMVPIVILQSYPQRMCLINLGLFSLSASAFIYRCSSLILTHPRFFPMTITLVPGSVWCLFSCNFFPFVCTARWTKTPGSWTFLGGLMYPFPRSISWLYLCTEHGPQWKSDSQLPTLHWYVVPHSLLAFHFQRGKVDPTTVPEI